MTVIALLQARTSSTRLPGKVLKPRLGEPMILRQIERLRRVRNIDRLMVVTSDRPSDDPLAVCCEGAGVEVFRGSLDDVLDRFYSAVRDAATPRFYPVHAFTGEVEIGPTLEAPH